MLNLTTACKEDFYFNGAFLSAKNGIVGGADGFHSFSVLPSREYTTDKAIGMDGDILLDTRLLPRTFVVPIYLYDVSQAKLRDIAAWLDVEVPTRFNWKSDTVYINCMLDGGGLDLSDVYFTAGFTELKFIAHDPFFYLITPVDITSVLITGSNNISITNAGNKLSFPKIVISGSGDITVKSYNSSNVEMTSCTITGVTTSITLDTLEKRVYDSVGANKINDMTGTFPILYTGAVKVVVSGTVTGSVITPRYRWI